MATILSRPQCVKPFSSSKKGPVLVNIWSSWNLMVLSSQSLPYNPREAHLHM